MCICVMILYHQPLTVTVVSHRLWTETTNIMRYQPDDITRSAEQIAANLVHGSLTLV